MQQQSIRSPSSKKGNSRDVIAAVHVGCGRHTLLQHHVHTEFHRSTCISGTAGDVLFTYRSHYVPRPGEERKYIKCEYAGIVTRDLSERISERQTEKGGGERERERKRELGKKEHCKPRNMALSISYKTEGVTQHTNTAQTISHYLLCSTKSLSPSLHPAPCSLLTSSSQLNSTETCTHTCTCTAHKGTVSEYPPPPPNSLLEYSPRSSSG